MYKLALNKVEKNINPYFKINAMISGSPTSSEYLLYSTNLNELKDALVKLTLTFQQFKDKVESTESDAYYQSFHSKKERLLAQINEDLVFPLLVEIESKKKYRKVKRKLTDKELRERLEEIYKEKESYFKGILSDLETTFYSSNNPYENNEEMERLNVDEYLYELEMKIQMQRNLSKNTADNIEIEFAEIHYEDLAHLSKKLINERKNLLKNKEEYRIIEEEVEYYEYKVGDIRFEVKYFNEKEEEYDIEIKTVASLVNYF